MNYCFSYPDSPRLERLCDPKLLEKLKFWSFFLNSLNRVFSLQINSISQNYRKFSSLHSIPFKNFPNDKSRRSVIGCTWRTHNGVTWRLLKAEPLSGARGRKFFIKIIDEFKITVCPDAPWRSPHTPVDQLCPACICISQVCSFLWKSNHNLVKID